MQDDDFEWDDVKAASNEVKHNITFDMARLAFRDSFAVEWPEDVLDEYEQRFALLGMSSDRLLAVAYTMRESRIRIISARRAEPFERRRYHNENAT